MKIKVCGITNVEDALMCEYYGANALGFIFYEKSSRYVSPGTVSEIISYLSPFTMKVGVFVNESVENIDQVIHNIKLNAIQLHGDESPQMIENISIPVIKSFRVEEGFKFSILSKYNNAAYLLDTFSPDKLGGTGESFNWDLIPDDLRSKIILAGGVSSDNIEYIHKKIRPAAVDLSSSLEKEPGKKDEKKVEEFFYKVGNLRRMKW